MSRLVSDVAWPKKARWVEYPVTRPARLTTRAVPSDGLRQFDAAIKP
jgi:hypothetical protein